MLEFRLSLTLETRKNWNTTQNRTRKFLIFTEQNKNTKFFLTEHRTEQNTKYCVFFHPCLRLNSWVNWRINDSFDSWWVIFDQHLSENCQSTPRKYLSISIDYIFAHFWNISEKKLSKWIWFADTLKSQAQKKKLLKKSRKKNQRNQKYGYHHQI